ncbi:MAG: hypothetical protein JEZ14_10120 [Marinilabiliaceae bacterium]|nr:hypothetical protein [Marinilabiliaceae bacterium]
MAIHFGFLIIYIKNVSLQSKRTPLLTAFSSPIPLEYLTQAQEHPSKVEKRITKAEEHTTKVKEYLIKVTERLTGV